MPIRNFNIPEDLDILYDLILSAFHYPDNPEWNADEDETKGLKETIKTFKRIYPLFKLTRWMSPAIRDSLLGFIWEDDDKPVGLVNVSRRGTTDSWIIGNVAVLPKYRRRGIARKLIQAALELIKGKGGNLVILDLIAENLPAYELYKSLGFVRFTSSIELELNSKDIPTQPSIPEGYIYEVLPLKEWRIPMEMAKRVVPEQVQVFDPIVKGRYYTPPVLLFLSVVMNRLRGVSIEDFALRDIETQQVAAIGYTSAQNRPGDRHVIYMNLELQDAKLVPFMLQYMLHKVKCLSSSHIVRSSLWEWCFFALDEYEKAGFEKRREGHRMGLILVE